MRKKLLIIALFILFLFLSYEILKMPSLGSVDNPSYNETARHYIEHSVSDTYAKNVITAIITDYRAFDTMGEITVLFTSAAAVMSVLAHVVKKTKRGGE